MGGVLGCGQNLAYKSINTNSFVQYHLWSPPLLDPTIHFCTWAAFGPWHVMPSFPCSRPLSKVHACRATYPTSESPIPGLCCTSYENCTVDRTELYRLHGPGSSALLHQKAARKCSRPTRNIWSCTQKYHIKSNHITRVEEFLLLRIVT